MRYLKDCWEGKDTPLRAFWMLYGLGGVIVTGLIFLPFWWFVPNITTDPMVAMKYVDLINALILPYMLFCTIAIWRCAKNTGKNAYGLKTILVITLVFCVMSVISVIPMLLK